MIIIKLIGGMCNQMFQYAYGLHLSLKYNQVLFLDTSFYNNQQGNGVIRKFELNKFPNLSYNLFNNLTNNKTIYRINESNKYTDNILGNDNYYIEGYWQNENYFISHEKEIRNAFKCNNTTEKFNQYKSKIDKYIKQGQIIISLHVRRTDYVKTNGFHPIQSINYYENAIFEIGNYDKLLIFSDDIKWCQENFKFDKMLFIQGLDNVEDLWLMKECTHNIIANSSFSWWGAWLNENGEKKVIAPYQWFGGDNNINSVDIVPKKWVRL